jgi:hypothetical protein
MRRRSARLALILSAVMAATLPAGTANPQDRPDAIAPYRYPSPATAAPLDSLEQQKAQSYRNSLEAQRTELQQQQDAGTLDIGGLRQLGQTNREIGRVDTLLQR